MDRIVFNLPRRRAHGAVSFRRGLLARRVTGHDLTLEARIVQRLNELRTIRAEFRGRSSALLGSRWIIGPKCCNDSRPKCEDYEHPNTVAVTGACTSLCTTKETRGDFKKCSQANNLLKQAIPSPLRQRGSLILLREQPMLVFGMVYKFWLPQRSRSREAALGSMAVALRRIARFPLVTNGER